MQWFARVFALGVLIVVFTSAAALAQGTADLSGRVTDESGAVLPGVTVTATQTDTGFTRTVVTDETGSYVMPNLPTGPYRLEVSLQGFRTYVQTGIVLQVGATPTINASLGVGNLEETVSVEAAAPLVDVRSAGISEVVENERIVELPLQGRQVTDLIVLAGAAVQTGRSPSRSDAGRREHLGRRRPVVRRRLPARRRDAQRPAGQRQPAAAVPGRAAGVQRGDQRPVRAERHALGRVGQRGDQVGHQHACTATRSSSSATSGSTRRARSRRSGPTASERTTGCSATSSAARSAVRSSATSCSSSAATRAPTRAQTPVVEHRVRADGGDAGRRLHGVRLAGVQRRPADHAARAVRQQPDQPGALQPGGA